MSDPVILETIKTVGSAITAICTVAGIWISLRSRTVITEKLKAQDFVLSDQTKTIEKLEKQTNGLQTALMMKVEESGIQVGKIIGTHETNLRRDLGEKH